MISCYLMGGLGNQLFQIATTISLAKTLGTEARFDLNQCITNLQGNSAINYKDAIYKKLKTCNLNDFKLKLYREKKFSYDKLPNEDNLLLYGYFQSEKYFKNHRKEILKTLIFDYDRIGTTINEINVDNLTSIHIRRGDYLKLSNVHPICEINYYNSAMEIIGGDFIVISDDIEWCKKNFKNTNIIYSPFTNEVDDIMLMSRCANNIIANSSFSWWGAWLNNNKNKKVIAPKKWFGATQNHDTKDLIPEEWIII